MGRKKLGSKENPLKEDDLKELEKEVTEFTIMQATITDDYLSYQFRCNKGDDKDDLHKIPANKEKLIEDSLKTAFGKLNVHAACMDDVFKHSNIDVKRIDDFHTDVLTGLYHVNGFSITGTPESESVVLTVTKYVSMGGRITFQTPKLILDNLSSYKFCEELKLVLDECRNEVEQFKAGHYIPAENDDNPAAFKQLSAFDQENGGEPAHEEDGFDINKARV